MIKGYLNQEEEFVFGFLKNVKPLSSFGATERYHLVNFTFKKKKKATESKMDL